MFVSLARRIFAARAIAAVFSVCASLIGLKLLTSEQYAVSSIAVASTAVFLPIFFQPFAKYVLVSGEWRRIGRIFWSAQPLISIIVLAISAVAASGGVSMGVALSAAILSIAQGWKEFCGELARSMGDIPRLRKLYVYDALTTAGLTGAALTIWPTVEAFLLSSAASSGLWSIRFTPFESLDSQGTRTVRTLTQVFRYSFGVSAATFLNTSMLAVGRAAIKGASPPELMGPVQFLLDILQKTVALIASSLTSAVIPEVRRTPLNEMVATLVSLLGVAFLCLAILAVGVALLPLSQGTSKAVPLLIAMSCAVYVWANRYKSVVLDMPLISSETHSAFVIPGAAASFGAILLASRLGLGVLSFMLVASSAICASGVISTLSAWRFGLLNSRAVLIVAAIPLVISAVAVAVLFS